MFTMSDFKDAFSKFEFPKIGGGIYVDKVGKLKVMPETVLEMDKQGFVGYVTPPNRDQVSESYHKLLWQYFTYLKFGGNYKKHIKFDVLPDESIEYLESMIRLMGFRKN